MGWIRHCLDFTKVEKNVAGSKRVFFFPRLPKILLCLWFGKKEIPGFQSVRRVCSFQFKISSRIWDSRQFNIYGCQCMNRVIESADSLICKYTDITWFSLLTTVLPTSQEKKWCLYEKRIELRRIASSSIYFHEHMRECVQLLLTLGNNSQSLGRKKRFTAPVGALCQDALSKY